MLKEKFVCIIVINSLSVDSSILLGITVFNKVQCHFSQVQSLHDAIFL